MTSGAGTPGGGVRPWSVLVVVGALLAAGCTAGRGSGAGLSAPVWTSPVPPPASAGMPASDGDSVAFTYGHLRLVLLDAAGHRRWQAERPGLRDVAPLLTSQLVVAATEEGLVAYDRATGDRRWDAGFGERASSPVPAGGALGATTWDGSIFSVDPGNGQVRWRRPIPGPSLGPPATDGNVVVTTWEAEDGGSAGAAAFDATSGAPRWAVPLEPDGVSGPAVLDSPDGPVVVVVSGDLAAHGLRLDSGEQAWVTDVDGAGSPEVPPLVLGRDRVLVAHRLGGLVLLDSSGRPLWRASSDGAAVRGGPVGPGPRGRFALPLDDGRLLVAGPRRHREVVDPAGRVSGVARGARGVLVVATREAESNRVSVYSGW